LDRRGWVDRSSVDAFVHYAEAVARRLGDRVPWWITQNEPWIIQLLGYQLGIHAPGIAELGAAVAAGHHVLLAHGAAYDAMRPLVAGRIGAAPNLLPCAPASDSEADRAAAWGSDGYVNRWFLEPLLGQGYPDDMREHWERAIGDPRAQRLPRGELLHQARHAGRRGGARPPLPVAGRARARGVAALG
jgi:beta-glucosidase